MTASAGTSSSVAGGMTPPIIVLGVPRSGTTLLRVLLGSHPEVLGTREMPWMTGSWETHSPSLRHLYESLTTRSDVGVAGMDGVTEELVFDQCRRFIRDILAAHLAASDKSRLLLKTPDDLGRIDFLLRLFPDAHYVHIRRDGRDVACSTFRARMKIGQGELLGYGPITIPNALQRWCDWELRVEELARTDRFRHLLQVQYERLATEPEPVLKEICAFLKLPFDPVMLDYSLGGQPLPKEDLGSSGVLARKGIDPSSVGTWKKQLSAGERRIAEERFGATLEAFGYERDSGSNRPSFTQACCRRLKHIGRFALTLPSVLARALIHAGRASSAKIARMVQDAWYNSRI